MYQSKHEYKIKIKTWYIWFSLTSTSDPNTQGPNQPLQTITKSLQGFSQGFMRTFKRLAWQYYMAIICKKKFRTLWQCLTIEETKNITRSSNNSINEVLSSKLLLVDSALCSLIIGRNSACKNGCVDAPGMTLPSVKELLSNISMKPWNVALPKKRTKIYKTILNYN